MTDQTEKIDEIFWGALQIASPEQRAAYLDQRCGGDLDARELVEKLLRAQPKAEEFLEKPIVFGPPTIDQPVSESPGTQIGPYKLLQQIGEGGFGIVFMAEQTEPVRRRVALKVIKPGMDTRQVIARFEAERQALAVMDHPNIARVLDAGATESGRPYFVMELVRGTPITQYCDENNLTVRERLELFPSVCQAIQHAHTKGIIHRDIKPTNVLVTRQDGQPIVKVIDFGIAKAMGQQLTEKTLFTDFAQMIGTPLYMSPEQAELSSNDIDTRSDIYSLGVLLYELLTGSTPVSKEQLKQAAFDEIRRIIREDDAQRPSHRISTAEAAPSIAAQRHTEPARLARLVRGELDWIVMKAIEKDRSRRYETASGFAADVQRYLSDEPVLACLPSVAYRLRKFARRNKATIAFSGVILLILLTLTAGIGWNVRDRAIRQTAVEQEVNLALQEAERWKEQENWPEALSAAKRAQGLLAGGGNDELRERVDSLRKDLDMVLRLEEIRLVSSELGMKERDNAAADRAYARAFSEYGIDVTLMLPDEAAARLRARTGVAVALVVALDHWASRRALDDEASASVLTALAQAVDSDPWRREVREARKRKDKAALTALAASQDFSRQPPTSLMVLSRALWAAGLGDAEIEVLRRAQRQYPGDFWINLNLADALWQKSQPLHSDEAVSFVRAALAVRPQSSAAHNNLGNALKDPEELDEAIVCYRKAIDLDPNNASAFSNLGNAVLSQDKLDEGIGYFRKAIGIDPNHSNAHNNLGNALKRQGKMEEAIACYRKAIDLTPRQASFHYGLAVALKKSGRIDEAVAAYRAAVALNPERADVRHALSIGLNNVAWHLATHSDPKERNPQVAVELAKEAVRLMPDAHWNTLGVAHYRAGDWKAAVASLEQSIKVETTDGRNSLFLAMAHWRLGNKDEARLWFGKAAAWIDENRPDHEEYHRFRAEAEELMKED